MKKKLLLIPLALLLAISLVAIGCPAEEEPPPPPPTDGEEPPPPPPEAKTLEIGIIYSLTGPGSDAETPARNGAVLAAEWINSKGGITVEGDKYLIELIVEDQKSSVDGAVTAATKLVEQDGVKFIVGQCVPDVMAAAASVTEPAKVLRSVSWSGTPGLISADKPYTFASVLGGADLMPGNYDYLVEAYPNVKKVAFMAGDEPGGRFSAEAVMQTAEAHGLTIVASEFFPWGSDDFYPVWTKILATEPDAVDAGPEFPISTALILKQGRELGFTGPIFTQTPADPYMILALVGPDFAYDFFDTSVDMLSPDLPPMFPELATLWSAKYTEPFVKDAYLGFDAFWCLMQAIEEAQSFDPTEVAATWENMASRETCFGTAHMGGLQTYGINHLVVPPCCISRLENGQVELIKWYTPEIP